MAPFIINPIVGIYWVYPMLNWSRSLSECPFSMTHDISNVPIWKARVCKTNNIRSWLTFQKQLLDTWKISSNLTFIALLKKFRFPSWVCQRTTALSVDGTLKSCGSETYQNRGKCLRRRAAAVISPYLRKGREVWGSGLAGLDAEVSNLPKRQTREVSTKSTETW